MAQPIPITIDRKIQPSDSNFVPDVPRRGSTVDDEPALHPRPRFGERRPSGSHPDSDSSTQKTVAIKEPQFDLVLAEGDGGF